MDLHRANMLRWIAHRFPQILYAAILPQLGEIRAEAPTLAGFETRMLKSGGFSVTYRTGQSSVEQVLAAVRAAGLHIKDISTEEPDLEDVFVSLTSAANVAA